LSQGAAEAKTAKATVKTMAILENIFGMLLEMGREGFERVCK